MLSRRIDGWSTIDQGLLCVLCISCTVNSQSVKTVYENYLQLVLLQLVDEQHNLVQIKT